MLYNNYMITLYLFVVLFQTIILFLNSLGADDFDLHHISDPKFDSAAAAEFLKGNKI